MTSPGSRRRLVPAYTALNGLGTPRTHPLLRDPLTVLRRRGDWIPPVLAPALRRLAEALAPGPLTLAEAAAHLGLPTGTVRVLAADLIDGGVLEARAAVLHTDQLDSDLLRRVLDGLLALRNDPAGASGS
ncbi:hypothetical protein GCM10009716_39020 [Streptomyces sodiiphilus]|uniref:DUF742 domain-containing protein n=1 Tax=Streptomyces sodiiphilus TaxID=226217 RepID=A0ABP5B1W9_9ACTN